MYLKIMISFTIAVLGLGLLLTSNPTFRVLLEFLVCASAVLVVLHSVRAEAQYLWAATFCGVAVAFNPIFPIALPSRVFFLLDTISIATFVLYSRAYKAKPRLAMTSVIDRSA
jgi:Family of unknown function (DUF6804)